MEEVAEKFLPFLETLLGRVVDDKSLAVTSTRAAFPDPLPLITSTAWRIDLGTLTASLRDDGHRLVFSAVELDRHNVEAVALATSRSV